MIESVEGADDLVPLIVGAIGHRDLVPGEVEMLGTRVRDFLSSLQARYRELRVTVLTSLADGADRLVVDAAKSLDIPVIYVLPMPTALYERDFDGTSLDEYRRILQSNRVLTSRCGTARRTARPVALRRSSAFTRTTTCRA